MVTDKPYCGLHWVVVRSLVKDGPRTSQKNSLLFHLATGGPVRAAPVDEKPTFEELASAVRPVDSGKCYAITSDRRIGTNHADKRIIRLKERLAAGWNVNALTAGN
jgi:hypothetical protein